MTWRRWEWGDAKDDAIEYAPTDVPVLPGHPKRNCEICMRHIELIEGGGRVAPGGEEGQQGGACAGAGDAPGGVKEDEMWSVLLLEEDMSRYVNPLHKFFEAGRQEGLAHGEATRHFVAYEDSIAGLQKTRILLDQTVWWKSSEGPIPIADMTFDHRANALQYLLTNSRRYFVNYWREELIERLESAPDVSSTSTFHAVERRWLGLDTQLFIRSRPVYEALWTANYGNQFPPPPTPPWRQA